MQPRRDLERMSMALRCWKGYKPNPDGRPAKEEGSCVPVNEQAESPAKMTKAQYKKKNAKIPNFANVRSCHRISCKMQ